MKKTYWMLLIFIGALYLLPIIFRPLMAPDEFRYAELSREMIERGDFITPRLLGVRYFEKTPMNFWATAASFKIFGQNGFALRLIPLLAAVGSALLVGLWCRRRKYAPETSANGTFLYLSSFLVWLLGTFATTDSLFAFFTTAVTVCSALAMESREMKERLLFLTGAGAALGFGFLTGGFTAFFLPAAAVTVYLLWQKRWKEFLFLPWLPLIVALLIIAPWGMAVHKAEPDFWHFFATHEHFKHFSDCFSEQYSAPWWLIFPFFFAGLFPAAFPVLTGMSRLRKDAWSDFFASPETRFALCSLLAGSIIPAFTGGQLPIFILPCFAPAAMLGAMLLDRCDPERAPEKLRQLTTVSALIFIIIGSLALLAGLFYLLWGTGFVPILPLKAAVWAPFLTTTALGLVVSGTFFFVYRKRKLPEPAAYFLLYGAVALISVWFMPVFTACGKMPEYELLEIANKLSGEKISRPRILTSASLMHAVAWCFKDSTVQVIDSAAELECGHRNAVANGERPLLLSREEINAFLKNAERKEGILIVLLKKDLEGFSKKIIPGQQLTTAGELCAFYYPGKQTSKEKK